MPARAPARRRGSSTGSNRRTLLIVGGLALAVVVFVILRRRSSSGSTLDTSGTPGPDLTGSASLAPNGGGANSPGQMPQTLLTQPDTLQQQVQTTDAGPTSQQSSTTTTATATSQPNQPAFQYGSGSPLGYYEVGSQYYQQSSPGSSTVVALPPSHPNVPLSAGGASMLPDAFAGTNVRRPGFQPD